MGFTSNNSAVTLLCIFNYNYNHNNPKKLANKYTKKLGIFKTIIARSKKSTETSCTTLNQSKLIKTVVSLLCISFWYGMHSKDATF